MSTILVITVGGSCQPIITAIRDFQPDFVLFFASGGARGSRLMVDGAGSPCSGEASIVTQLELPADHYRVVELNDPDTLDICYKTVRAELNALINQYPNCRHIADYTGGTKTMTVALGLAAVESGWELSLVRGARTDLVKVVDGTEMASLANTWEVRIQQRMEEAYTLFNQFAYSSAGELLESLLRSSPLNPDSERTIRNWVGLCRGFDAWDRFDHHRAAQLLAPFQSQVVPQWKLLKILAGQARGNGYEMVFDLVLNAERRASRGRYDDAVARLYRALEMLAQARMSQLTPPLDSSKLDPALLPESLRAKYEGIDSGSNLKKLGLRQDYELLADLNDPLGEVFTSMKGRVLDTLDKRNNSILAHGNSPLGQTDYKSMHTHVETLIQNGLVALKVTRNAAQFPCLTHQGVQSR